MMETNAKNIKKENVCIGIPHQQVNAADSAANAPMERNAITNIHQTKRKNSPKQTKQDANTEETMQMTTEIDLVVIKTMHKTNQFRITMPSVASRIV